MICDSYVAADHDLSLDPIDVAEGEDSDSDEGDDDEDASDAMEELGVSFECACTFLMYSPLSLCYDYCLLVRARLVVR